MSLSEPAASGTEIWKASSRLMKDKAIVVLLSLLLLAVAGEAIRVSVLAWATGITPSVFGLMPTRELAWTDSLGVIAVALAGIAFVGFHLLRLLLRGFPRRILLVEEVGGTPEVKPEVDETAHLQVEYDGLLRPVRYCFFSDIREIDAVARGTMGGGGHQVRLRLRDRRLALAVARFDSAHEAAELVARLDAARVRILALDKDIRRDWWLVAGIACGVAEFLVIIIRDRQADWLTLTDTLLLAAMMRGLFGVLLAHAALTLAAAFWWSQEAWLFVTGGRP